MLSPLSVLSPMVGMVKRAGFADMASLAGEVEGAAEGAVGVTGVWKIGDTVC